MVQVGLGVLWLKCQGIEVEIVVGGWFYWNVCGWCGEFIFNNGVGEYVFFDGV